MDEVNFLSVLSAYRHTVVEVCGSIELLRKTLKVISCDNNVQNLHFAIPKIPRSADGRREFCVPPGLGPKQFTNLTNFTINSPDMARITLESCSELFRLVGPNLKALSLWPSSPTGFYSVINEHIQNLEYLRMDAIRTFPDTPPVHLGKLVEVFLSYPEEYLCNVGYYAPNLKKCCVMGFIDDDVTLAYGFSLASPTMEVLEYGDSAACASEVVIQAVARQFPVLRSLTIHSDQTANEITVTTTTALLQGCPLLESLDMSRALVYFDDGALEVLGNFQVLRFVKLGYSSRVLDSLYALLAQSTSLQAVVLVLLSDEEWEEREATSGLDVIREHYRSVKFYLENY